MDGRFQQTLSAPDKAIILYPKVALKKINRRNRSVKQLGRDTKKTV